MRLVVLAGLLIALPCCTSSSGAKRPEAPAGESPQEQVDRRTPRLSWVFDDRLNSLSAPEIGLVRVGDTVTITVDTRQRFGGAARTSGTEAELNGQLFFPTTKPSAGAAPQVSLPPSLQHFYVSMNGADPLMQPRACTVGEETPTRPTDALPCVADAERSSSPAWRRGAEYPTVYVCPPAGGTRLVPADAAKAEWSLLGWDLGKKTYVCMRSWDVVTDRGADVDAVTLVVTTDGAPREVGAVNSDGVWRLTTALAEGYTSLELRIKYESGLLNQKGLGAFEVTSVEEHSLVRIQPEILTTQSFRAVNLAVAITPVSQRFFDQGPWDDGIFSSKSILNGVSPSLVVRFSGDNVTVVQFGVAASLFLNRAMLINAGLLFGSSDPSRHWDPKRNFFIGFALDPVLMTGLRSQNGSSSTTKGE